jgi:glutaminase
LNTEILCIVASTLANGGINPFTGERIWSSSTVKNVLSMMLMCGMYDYSGECAFKIGIPSKSGVAGAVMIVIPNVMGIVTWSPNLDSIGNSYRGIQFSELFGKTFNFHIFDSISDTTKLNPTLNNYSSKKQNEFSELCLAAQKGDFNYLKKLYNSGVDMSQSDYDKRTALHLAVCENHIQIVKFLIIVAKVDINIRDRWNNTPYDEAVRLNHEGILSVFKPFTENSQIKQRPPSSKKPPLPPSKRKEWVKTA